MISAAFVAVLPGASRASNGSGASGASGAPLYQVAELTAPGAVTVSPYGINSAGAIAGVSTDASGTMNASFWRGGAWVGLNGRNAAGSAAYAVNSAGSVAGGIFTREGDYRACLWQRDQVVDLTHRTSVAQGLNDAGSVVGWALDEGGTQRAFLWRNGGLRWLTDLPSIASALNNRGQVAGFAVHPDGARAFLWQERAGRATRAAVVTKPSDLIDLGTLGGESSQALAINNAGQVVGWAANAEEEPRAFLYGDGRMRELPGLGGAFSRANGINASGDAVGVAQNESGETRAVVWRGGHVYDLNALVPPDSGWVLFGAVGISDTGRIVGYGAYRGELRSFVLTRAQ